MPVVRVVIINVVFLHRLRVLVVLEVMLVLLRAGSVVRGTRGLAIVVNRGASQMGACLIVAIRLRRLRVKICVLPTVLTLVTVLGYVIRIVLGLIVDRVMGVVVGVPIPVTVGLTREILSAERVIVIVDVENRVMIIKNKAILVKQAING